VEVSQCLGRTLAPEPPAPSCVQTRDGRETGKGDGGGDPEETARAEKPRVAVGRDTRKVLAGR